MEDIFSGYNALDLRDAVNKYDSDELNRLLELLKQMARNKAEADVRLENYRSILPLTITKNVGRSKYDKSVRNTVGDYLNIDLIRAKQQSVADKIANGTVQFLANTGATYVDNTLGSLVGLGSGIENAVTGNNDVIHNFLEGWTNNPITRGALKLRDTARSNFSIYRDRNALAASIGLLLTDPNFWAEDMLVNAGFTVGSMLSAYNNIYGSLSPKSFRMSNGNAGLGTLTRATYNKLTNHSTIANELSRIDKARKYKKLQELNVVENAVELLAKSKLPKAGLYFEKNGFADLIYTSMKMSTGEARMESYNAYKEFLEDLEDLIESRRIKDTLKILNDQTLSEDLKYAKILQINQKANDNRKEMHTSASELALNVFALNMAILTLSNAVDQQFFIRNIKPPKGNIAINTKSNIAKLKESGIDFDLLESIGKLSAKEIEKKGGESFVKSLGGKKSTDEFLNKLRNVAKKKGVSLNLALELSEGMALIMENAYKNGLWSFMTGKAKNKTQALMQGLIFEPSKEGWEELSLAWASEFSKLYFSDYMNSKVNNNNRKYSEKSLIDVAGIIGVMDDIFFSLPGLSGSVVKKVWDENWNEGFMGAMTGLLGTLNIGGIMSIRLRKREALRAYNASKSRNDSMKKILGLSDEEFKTLYKEFYEHEQSMKELMQEANKTRIGDFWANSTAQKFNELSDYKKELLQNAKAAEDFYNGNTETYAKMRAIFEGLAAAKKYDAAKYIDNDLLALDAMTEAVLAKAAKAYELGISDIFRELIELIYGPIEKIEGEDELDTIKNWIRSRGLTRLEQQEGAEPIEKLEETIFDDIISDSQGDKIERINERLKSIADNIKEKQEKYIKERQKIEKINIQGLTDNVQHILAKSMVMQNDYIERLNTMLNDDNMRTILKFIYDFTKNDKNEKEKDKKGIPSNIMRKIRSHEKLNADELLIAFDALMSSPKFVKEIGKLRSLKLLRDYLNKQIETILGEKEIKDLTDEENILIENIYILIDDILNKIESMFNKEPEILPYTKTEYEKYHRYLKGEEDLKDLVKDMIDKNIEDIFEDNDGTKYGISFNGEVVEESREKISFNLAERFEGKQIEFNDNILQKPFEIITNILLMALNAFQMRSQIETLLNEPELYENDKEKARKLLSKHYRNMHIDQYLTDIDIEDYRLVYDLIHGLNDLVDGDEGREKDIETKEKAMLLKYAILERVLENLEGKEREKFIFNIKQLEDIVDEVNNVFKNNAEKQVRNIILLRLELALRSDDDQYGLFNSFDYFNIDTIKDELGYDKSKYESLKSKNKDEMSEDDKNTLDLYERVTRFLKYIEDQKNIRNEFYKKLFYDEDTEKQTVKISLNQVEATRMRKIWREEYTPYIYNTEEKTQKDELQEEQEYFLGGVNEKDPKLKNDDDDYNDNAINVNIYTDSNSDNTNDDSKGLERIGESGHDDTSNTSNEENISESKVNSSSRKPIYVTNDLKNRTLIENDDPVSKVAKVIYQDSVDKGIVNKIEELQKEYDKTANEEDKIEGIVLIRPRTKDAGENSWKANIEVETLTFDSELNSMVYVAMEIPQGTDTSSLGILSLHQKVTIDGKTYIIVGVYNDRESKEKIEDRTAYKISEKLKKELENNTESWAILKDKEGKILRSKIRKKYSGRLATIKDNGTRKLRKAKTSEFGKNAAIIVYALKSLDGNGRLTFDHGEIDIENCAGIEKEKYDGSVYIITEANDGKTYRIRADIPRYSRYYIDGENNLFPQEVIQNINSNIESISKIIADKLNGKSTNPVSSDIAPYRKALSKLLVLVKQRKEIIDLPAIYYLLIVKEDANGIKIYFNDNENASIKISKNESGLLINDTLYDEANFTQELTKAIDNLYLDRGFRVQLPNAYSWTRGGNTSASLWLIDNGYILVDLVENEKGIIFYDSSFEFDKFEIEDDNVKVIESEGQQEPKEQQIVHEPELKPLIGTNLSFLQDGENIKIYENKDNAYVISLGDEELIVKDPTGNKIIVEESIYSNLLKITYISLIGSNVTDGKIHPITNKNGKILYYIISTSNEFKYEKPGGNLEKAYEKISKPKLEIDEFLELIDELANYNKEIKDSIDSLNTINDLITNIQEEKISEKQFKEEIDTIIKNLKNKLANIGSNTIIEANKLITYIDDIIDDLEYRKANPPQKSPSIYTLLLNLIQEIKDNKDQSDRNFVEEILNESIDKLNEDFEIEEICKDKINKAIKNIFNSRSGQMKEETLELNKDSLLFLYSALLAIKNIGENKLEVFENLRAIGKKGNENALLEQLKTILTC